MPHPLPGTRPFDAAGLDRSATRMRIVECHVAFRKHRDRGDAGVRMHGHASSQRTQVSLEQVEKHERLQLLPEVGRAHQPDDGTTVPLPSSPMNDFAWHDWLLSKARDGLVWMFRGQRIRDRALAI